MQMTLLEREQIEELAAPEEGLCISMYLPVHRAGQQASQAPIRLKNLLAATLGELQANDVRPSTARALLAPARQLLNDRDFWLHPADGLAVFLSSEGMRTFRLPFHVGELHMVSDHFHLKPLLGSLIARGRFLILAISLNRVRLFDARRDMIRQIDLQDVPASLRDTIGLDWKKRSLQFRTGTGPAAGGKRSAAFHGQGSRRDDKKDQISAFLRLVDEGVKRSQKEPGSPIVLAGVAHITAIFRAITSSPHVLDDTVETNPDQLSPAELLDRAWPIVEPHFLSGQQAASQRYEALAGTGRASNDLAVVLKAAFEGRVEALFTARDTQCWGRWKLGDRPRPLDVHPEKRPGDQDLLDLAAVRSFATGADVYLVEPDRVPGQSQIAAIFRY